VSESNSLGRNSREGGPAPLFDLVYGVWLDREYENRLRAPGGVAADANDFLLYDTNTGKLFYDADGNGAGAKVEFVTLVGIPALTAADFTII